MKGGLAHQSNSSFSSKQLKHRRGPTTAVLKAIYAKRSASMAEVHEKRKKKKRATVDENAIAVRKACRFKTKQAAKVEVLRHRSRRRQHGGEISIYE